MEDLQPFSDTFEFLLPSKKYYNYHSEILHLWQEIAGQR